MSIKSYKSELSISRGQCFGADNLRSDPVSAILCFVKVIDALIIDVFQTYLQKKTENVSLVALGGYGRMELCPHSDIDLLILHEGDHNDEVIARLVRALWDMGFPLGCVVRNIGECRKILGEDIASDTALLDARYLTGSKVLYKRLVHQLIEPFFRRKRQWFVNEMNSALKEGIFSENTSIYTVEPNLKNGICTLRDCQRVVWGTRVFEGKFTGLYNHQFLSFDHKNKQRFFENYQSLLRMRCALHMIADRRLDVLEFSQQQPVAQYLGLGPDHAGTLMEQFFKNVHVVKQLLMLYLERQNVRIPFLNKVRLRLSAVTVGRKLKLLDGILSPCGIVPPPDVNPVKWILETYLLSIQYQAFPGTELENRIRLISDNMSGKNTFLPDGNDLFIKLISSRAALGSVLRSMYETGFLEILLPEIGSIKCKVEYDSYHEFTVDQHTLYALSLVDQLEKDSDTQVVSIVQSIGELFTLRMAVLLHDIGKSLEGDHAYSGAVIAINVGDRFGIDENQRDLIAFLVQHHLDLSLLAFQREPEEQTIATFAEVIKDSRTLDLLYLLTIVDIRSVGRKTWTAWKGLQLQAVYDRVRKSITGRNRTDLKYNLSEDNKISQTGYEHLFTTLPHTGVIQVVVEKYTGFERLIVCGADRPHFFADIVGCLSSEGYNILSAQISTINGFALDIFNVEPDSIIRLPSTQRIQNINRKWELLVKKLSTTDKLIEERLRLYPAKSQRVSKEKISEIVIDNVISKDFTVIELKTPDRYGLLYRVAQCLSQCEVNIVSAKLSTRVSKAIDIFYVIGPDGQKILSGAHQVQIRTKVLELLSLNW